MLLLHQTGSVKIGEVVRYTVTYTPSHDRILPSPEVLHLRIRNTSSVVLRGAFVHGPYTLSVAAYPAHFDPNSKFEDPRRYGVPEFEPMLKANGTWSTQLVVPDNIRQSAGLGARSGDFGARQGDDDECTASWDVEIASQVIFSNSAAVGYEVLLARDDKSLNLGSTSVIGGQAQVLQPGKLTDFQQDRTASQPKGLFSNAITLKIRDTVSLWNTPALPGWDDDKHGRPRSAKGEEETKAKKKKVHLVILTHGLHSNLGADMLYMKESIDAGVRQAKIDAKLRKERERERGKQPSDDRSQSDKEAEDEDEDEEVVVRGFSGNATRTERGIKFLGKRLARYILTLTYPDQPLYPSIKTTAETIASAFKGEHEKDEKPVHKNSTIHSKSHHDERHRGFQVTSISFIGHSLGGLVQTYAIAYIQKHSPQFFDVIKPINFVTLASPLLGLSNENPLYVKFALDFGLVGRTGQDLGLTWRPPTIARSGWGAIVGTLGENAHKKVMGESQPESKPLLRILPTGPAHAALKKFRNRTVYSNVVNDGIVPLRTSCLLFLDWQGLGRVEKARREAGLVETVVGFGWAELTGANLTSSRSKPWTPQGAPTLPPIPSVNSPTFSSSEAETDYEDDYRQVPQPSSNATLEDNRQSLKLAAPFQSSPMMTDNPFSAFFKFFKGSEPPKTPPPPPSPKQSMVYKRSQTITFDNGDSCSRTSPPAPKPKVTAGLDLDEQDCNSMSAPPRTSFFESAGDLLNPKLPTVEYVIDPSCRPRTIFHDRVYHPSDIPPPPLKKRKSSLRKDSSSSKASSTKGSPNPNQMPHEDSGLSTRDYDDASKTDPDREADEVVDRSSMRVEEKIARAYHKGMSWRKVLVKLEPDAHNNIIVRRMFANAHGWPVVKHVVDAHFSNSAAARTPDDKEKGVERTKSMTEPPDSTGAETKKPDPAAPASASASQQELPQISSSLMTNGTSDTVGNEKRDSKHKSVNRPRPLDLGNSCAPSEAMEARDTVPELRMSSATPASAHHSSPPQRTPSLEKYDSAGWSDHDWIDSADESDGDMHLAYGGFRRPSGGDEGKPDRLGPGWWAEKIVGKGAGKKRAVAQAQANAQPETQAQRQQIDLDSPTLPRHGHKDSPTLPSQAFHHG